ncbi:MAG: GNVR domain-containing protein [Terracidiphilus sp.]|jgi:capsule polysaccharide export protein KpsE/RkpR
MDRAILQEAGSANYLSNWPFRSTGDGTLSTADEQLQDVDDNASDWDIPVAELVAAIWLRRGRLALVTGLGLLLSVGIAFLIPNEYTSTAQLMPPDAQSLSNPSVLTALGGAGSFAPSLGGSLMNARTPTGTFIGILESQTAKDDIINRFDLRRVYHRKLYFDTRKILTKRTTIVEDKKSGTISIAVMDRDRYRARNLAEAYVEELDKLVNKVSTSSARRERIFLEERLKSVKSDLDASSRALSQFSSRNATMDPQKQGEATVEAAGKLQGELIAAESELSGLKAQYTDDNMRVREVRGRIDELQSQLRKMSGVGDNVNGADLKADQLLPSVRMLPILGLTYYDLYRQVTMQDTIYQTLTKQYELAKVQEAKEIPPVKVLDEPDVPERKSSPHRSIIIALGTLLSCLAGVAWILGQQIWHITDDRHPVKAFGIELWQFIRSRDTALPL